MPRGPRAFVDKGYYHIVARGNDGRDLFRCGDDYVRLLEIVKQYIKKYKVRIFHFCLMPNHIHLLVQAMKWTDLPKFMQGILQVYASFFHSKYNSTGFLFQNRYKSFHIEKESYLLECARYIERNPLRARICKDPKDYLWNSYLLYAEGREIEVIGKPNPCFSDLSCDASERQRMFREYVVQERPYDHVVDRAFRLR